MTSPRVRFHRAARRELRRAVDRYDDHGDGLGSELVAEVEAAVHRIMENPASGSPHVLGTRRMQVRRFPFSTIYTVRGDEIVILAVAHHRRRPDYWIERV